MLYLRIDRAAGAHVKLGVCKVAQCCRHACALARALSLLTRADSHAKRVAHSVATSHHPQACVQLTSLLERKDANGHFVALETLATVAAAPAVATALRPHLPLVVTCLGDSDGGVKKRAIDVLAAICSTDTAPTIVQHLIEHLQARLPYTKVAPWLVYRCTCWRALLARAQRAVHGTARWAMCLLPC